MNDLSQSERAFISKVVPLCSQISHWVREKSSFIKKSNNKLHPVVVLAHILIGSQWGTHPLSYQFYNKRISNNLAMLKVDHLWQGKTNEYENSSYKAYQSWMHFATDYSDSIVFTGDLSIIIVDNSILGQINQLSTLSDNPVIFAAKSQSLIEVHQLDRLFLNC